MTRHVSSLRSRWGGRIAPPRALFAIIRGECLRSETAWRREVYWNCRYRFVTIRQQHQVKLCDIETNCKALSSCAFLVPSNRSVISRLRHPRVPPRRPSPCWIARSLRWSIAGTRGAKQTRRGLLGLGLLVEPSSLALGQSSIDPTRDRQRSVGRAPHHHSRCRAPQAGPAKPRRA
jgi:hypothetical protein